MLSNLSQTGVRTLFNFLSTDIEVTREFSFNGPVQRLIGVMDLVKDKTMLPKQKEIFDFITTRKTSEIKSHFNNLYWKMVKI